MNLEAHKLFIIIIVTPRIKLVFSQFYILIDPDDMNEIIHLLNQSVYK